LSSPAPTRQPLGATKELQSMFPVRPTAGGASAPLATQAYGQPALSAANNNASNAATPAAGTAYPATSAYGQPVAAGKNAASAAAHGYGSAYPNSGAGYASASAGYGSNGSAYPSTGTPAYGASGAAYPAAGGSPYGGSNGSAYPSSAGGAAYGGGAAAGSALGKTTAYGMPALNAWQPSTLPVSPWSTISSPGVGPLGGGVDTTTILRSDLKALKRSRLKGWGYLFLSVGIFGSLGYFGIKQFVQMRKDLNVAKQQVNDAKRGYEATLTKLGVSESAAAAATSNTPGAVVATPPAGTAAVAVTSPATTKLADDLKKSLATVAGLTVEARGDRVVLAVDQAALFEGNELEASLAGYKIMYKLTKVLKPVVKDRRVVITVPGDAKKGKTWNVAAARAVSLGRSVIDDIGVDPHRVTSSAPASPQGRGGRHVEFSLEPAPETTKS
jgi:hypothetical protein